MGNITETERGEWLVQVQADLVADLDSEPKSSESFHFPTKIDNGLNSQCTVQSILFPWDDIDVSPNTAGWGCLEGHHLFMWSIRKSTAYGACLNYGDLGLNPASTL